MKFTLTLLTDGKNQNDTIIESFTISLETGIRIKLMHFFTFKCAQTNNLLRLKSYLNFACSIAILTGTGIRLLQYSDWDTRITTNLIECSKSVNKLSSFYIHLFILFDLYKFVKLLFDSLKAQQRNRRSKVVKAGSSHFIS